MNNQHWYMAVSYDSSDFEDLINEMEDEPKADTILALESVLSTAFAATQAVVHIQTGRLRASGRVSSTVRNGIWQGEITYGGPGTGVEYAWYEQRREGHNYMDPAEALDETFEDAIMATVVPE